MDASAAVMEARPCVASGAACAGAGGWVSAKGFGDALSQRCVTEVVDVAPGRVGDLLGLKMANVGGGAEEEPDVDVPVVRLALGVVGGDGVDVDVEGALVRGGDRAGGDAGFLGEFP
jgi:hypothetical protein